MAPFEPPPTSPWINAVAFLGLHLDTRSARAPKDLPHALSWALAPSTITTYRRRAAAIGKLAASLGAHSTPGYVVEQFLLQQLAHGAPGASLRVTLSTATFLHSLGFLPQKPAAHLWRLSTAAQRLREPAYDTRVWAVPSDILTAAQRASTPQHWQTVAITIVALSLGLRIGEAAQLRPDSFDLPTHDPSRASITFRAEKARPGHPSLHTRRTPTYVSLWAAYLLDSCSPGPGAECFLTIPQINDNLRALYPAHYTFHAFRRGCARGMYQAGCSMADIMRWIRWSDERTAAHYIGDAPPLLTSTWLLPTPPDAAGTAAFLFGGPNEFWPVPPQPGPVLALPTRPFKKRKGT